MQNASVRLNVRLETCNSLRSIFDCIVCTLFDKLGELFGSQHYLLNAINITGGRRTRWSVEWARGTENVPQLSSRYRNGRNRLFNKDIFFK